MTTKQQTIKIVLFLLFTFGAVGIKKVYGNKYWVKEEIGNPLVDFDKCGRKQTRSFICDPDNVLTLTQVNALDRMLEMTYNSTTCCKTLPGGYQGVVVIVNGMQMNKVDYETEDYDPVLRGKQLDQRLQEAKQFAYTLLHKYNISQCAADFLIFYSVVDCTIYTAVGEKTNEKLDKSVIGEITGEARIFFGPDRETFDGLKQLIDNYRQVFVGKYQRRGIWHDEPSAVVYSAADVRILTANLHIVLTTVFVLMKFL